MIRENFNSGWNIMCDEKMSLGLMKKDIKVQPVQLPHDAMIHEMRTEDTPNQSQTGFYPGKQYVYTKSFAVPMVWKEKTVYIEFEGIYQTAMVYLNGRLAAENKFGYSNFYVRLDDYLEYGEMNELKVIADNSAVPNSRWYSGAGIYRNVNLLTGDCVHVIPDGLKITTLSIDREAAIVGVEINLCNQERRKVNTIVNTCIKNEYRTVGLERTKVTMFANTEETVHQQFCIENPLLWSCDSPNLYTCEVVIEDSDKKIDITEENFGIRTITVDAKRGLLLNGNNIKLRGTCIHHDNGVIGAATFRRAEERKILQLKEAGFNSIRSSHQPMSREMLDACDRLGMLVMDELSDFWTYHKNPHDIADSFVTSWEQEVKRMVAKDYNHPSVILYSAGNEIPEIGLDSGAKMKRHICNKFHELDSGRFTIDGMNGSMAITYSCGMENIIGDLMEAKTDSMSLEGANAINALNAYMSMTASDEFAIHQSVTDALEESAMASDIIGLNYLTGRYVLEKELHPNKTVIGTETYPANIVRLWKLVKTYPHVLGDFTWTGYDYLGEAGCGIFHYDGSMNFTSKYPERTAYIGDLDLIGYRRPISYFREIVYGLRKAPYIAVERVDKYGMKSSKTAWMFKDNIASWTWHGYEGKPAIVDVYSCAEEVELFLNGKSLGKKAVGEKKDFTATYQFHYEPGELLAISYENNIETGRFKLETADKDVKLEANADRTILQADGEDLSFITVRLVDKNGNENLQKKVTVQVEVLGEGYIQGFGSADPLSSAGYDDVCCETYDGYLLAVIRAGMVSGEIKVVFTSEESKRKVVVLQTI